MDFNSSDALFVAAQLPADPTEQEIEHAARSLVSRKAGEALEAASDFVRRQANQTRNSRYLQEQAHKAKHYAFVLASANRQWPTFTVAADLLPAFCRAHKLNEC